MGFKDKLNQILYAFSTEDRYAEYDASRSNNNRAEPRTHTRTVSRNGIQLGDASGFGDEENPQSTNAEGLSETILAWRIIETWTSEHHVDLDATLAEPCTKADIAAAENDLGIQFPAPVRASLRLHDGQVDLDSMPGTGGLFYGMQLMAIDEIVAMTKTWRTVAERMELDLKVKQNIAARQQLISPTGSSGELDKTATLVETQPGYKKVDTVGASPDPELEKRISSSANGSKFKKDLPQQKSFPPGAVEPVYAHPMWIPLVTDLAGNNIGVDLAPGPNGKVGQVIVFGRDFDVKFVLANHWGDFLLMFANDLEAGNYEFINVIDDVLGGDGELSFKDKKTGREAAYLRVLTDRAIAKYRSQMPPQSKQQQQQQHQKPHLEKPLVAEPAKERVISRDITDKNKENELDAEPVKEDKEEVEVIETQNTEEELGKSEDKDSKDAEEVQIKETKDNEDETVDGFNEIKI
ncbi:unnamed protein product [Cyberlindnera jadinii]|uniref:Cell wall assembly and cell proliferation coordinating protein n=1 Tax=Cyberlindnera jadinii (strain ATCC 18201 / CBS 1600 / BCRC 20928 / JCM 3617 / NBRC 0987 / NRRL Y-1542) TaxID=983966 RepID=A0A0H5BZT2_CYBJN|nr:cell wall assembly and cell proliferation coordinating protein [Cyberlindnera jadinii NRRL Y-1542]ODV76354.1 cell wall assembly and cell proliferation coordinating protein [Cyberlindnera jadinii NRRL Y-1542]CEP21003.1 unnamed protein product [Cyberlindnera jadinii]